MPCRTSHIPIARSVLTTVTLPEASRALEEGLIESIVIAREQEESLRHVPVSIAAFAAVNLDQHHIHRAEEAVKRAPNSPLAPTSLGSSSNLNLCGNSVFSARIAIEAINTGPTVQVIGSPL